MKNILTICCCACMILCFSCSKQADIGLSIGPDGKKMNAIRGPYIDPNGNTVIITKDTAHNNLGPGVDPNGLGPGVDPNGVKSGK